MASLSQLASNSALRPGHRRGGAAAAALRQPLAARAPGAVQGRRGALVVRAATHKARAGRAQGSHPQHAPAQGLHQQPTWPCSASQAPHRQHLERPPPPARAARR